MNICFIGYGKIAKAMAKGLRNHPEYKLFAAAPSLSEGMDPDGVLTTSDNLLFLKEIDIVILAVKPALVPEVLTQIKNEMRPEVLILSLVTGLSLKTLASYCSEKQPIVRAMPNIAMAVNQSAVPLVGNASLSKLQKDAVSRLFEYSGITTWLEDEGEIDMLTALSGSGPAYLFLFLEAMIAAGLKLGLSEAVAKRFTLQTAKGALALITELQLEPSALRQQVTSPNGTTAAAIQVLQENGFEDLIASAIEAAYQRAKALAK